MSQTRNTIATPKNDLPLAVVTGASSGIGAATARRLIADGWRVVAVARRGDRLAALAADCGADALKADLTDPADITRLADHVAALGGARALVNNAGGAIGTESVEGGLPEDWSHMFASNVLATQRVTAALLPQLRRGVTAKTPASIVTVTSVAGHEPYVGGGGYNAAKAAEVSLMRVLRLELVGEPIRVIEIAPGMVATEEFSLVRFRGDAERAAAVYDGVAAPLRAEDIADIISYTLSVPAHVNIDQVTVRPLAQAAAGKVVRGELRVRTD